MMIVLASTSFSSGAHKIVYHRVIRIRNLNDTTYTLQFERKGLQFQPGQYLSVGQRGEINMREYSIYSPIQCDYLELLIKEVEGGSVSRSLRRLIPGDELRVEGPFGFFLMDEQIRQEKISMIGTGTGISPFHCFVGSYPSLNYMILHGVRYNVDIFDFDDYDSSRIIRCISRDDGGDYQGRVIQHLGHHDLGDFVYLCGNCDMIYEVYDRLSEYGITRERIFAEVYF